MRALVVFALWALWVLVASPEVRWRPQHSALERRQSLQLTTHVSHPNDCMCCGHRRMLHFLYKSLLTLGTTCLAQNPQGAAGITRARGLLTAMHQPPSRMRVPIGGAIARSAASRNWC
jgi:hypothetical protein